MPLQLLFSEQLPQLSIAIVISRQPFYYGITSTPQSAMGVFLIVFSLGIVHVVSEALSYRIAPYEKACFYQPVLNTTSAKIYFYYSSQSQDPGLDVSVHTPSNQLVYSGTDEQYGDQVLDAVTTGDYMFCFSNIMSFTSKVVDFDITVGPDDGDWGKSSSGLQTNPFLNSFEATLSNLRSELRTLQSYQRYFKNRSSRNSRTVNSTKKLVFGSSVFGCLLVVGMAVLQVFILKNFFTKSTRVRI